MDVDLVVAGGTVVDGSGGEPFAADVGVTGDRIVAVGDLSAQVAGTRLQAAGLVVAPGFINTLSHSQLSLLQDGRSLSELKQGVTTQVIGEGESMGPLTRAMRDLLAKHAADIGVEVTWTRLSEYLAAVERRGISQNVCSYVGAGTLREHVVGYADRPPTAAELDRMRGLLAEEMADGAVGVGAALIYPPGAYASTDELVALCETSARFGGRYAAHMRSERNLLVEAVDETLHIARAAAVPARIWHLKAAGEENWPKMAGVLERVEGARREGLDVVADVYPYVAGGTGLASIVPPRFHDGGPKVLYDRLEDAEVRAAIRRDIEADDDSWENMYRAAGDPANVVVLGVRKEENLECQGRSLAELAAAWDMHPIDAALELLRRDRSRVFTAYFVMSEANLRAQMSRPWVGVCSDAASVAPEGVSLRSPVHPRAYGAFARVLGRYVREEHLLTLAEAIRRMTSLPADWHGLTGRGRLSRGAFADIVVFDPATIADTATYTVPHSFATGVHHVVVNGHVALRDGAWAGAYGGRALPGPGQLA